VHNVLFKWRYDFAFTWFPSVCWWLQVHKSVDFRSRSWSTGHRLRHRGAVEGKMWEERDMRREQGRWYWEADWWAKFSSAYIEFCFNSSRRLFYFGPCGVMSWFCYWKYRWNQFFVSAQIASAIGVAGEDALAAPCWAVGSHGLRLTITHKKYTQGLDSVHACKRNCLKLKFQLHR
jgi:hypothetical protein